MADITTAELAEKLQQFYCKVKTQEKCNDESGIGCEPTLPSEKIKMDDSEYKKSFLIAIRAAYMTLVVKLTLFQTKNLRKLMLL